MAKKDGRPDRMIWRQDLQTSLGVHSETMRRWMRDGTLPRLDVNLSQKTQGWRLSTLRAAGIHIE